MAEGAVATGTFPTPMVTVASAAGFIPEIWSDEIIAEYEKNLVLAPLVKKMSMKGKKGDTIHVPRPYRTLDTSKTLRKHKRCLRCVSSTPVMRVTR
jgi:hypothetical protein